MLPETPHADAAGVAERLRRSVEAAQFQAERERVPVTISLGVALYPTAVVETGQDLLKLADEALYRAKEGGRNQVQFHED